MQNHFQRRARIQRTAAVATVVGTAAAVLLINHLKNDAASGASPVVVSAQASPAPASAPAPAAAGSGSPGAGQYRDGIYSSTVQYRVPSSIESIRVSLTVKNGVVTDSQVQNSESDGTCAMFQEDFASEYRSYVVGKNLSGLNLDVVAGASDTTIGFDQAVDSIRTQAQG